MKDGKSKRSLCMCLIFIAILAEKSSAKPANSFTLLQSKTGNQLQRKDVPDGFFLSDVIDESANDGPPTSPHEHYKLEAKREPFVYGNNRRAAMDEGRRSTDGSRKSEDEIEIGKRFVYGNGRRSTEDSRDKFAKSNNILDKRFVYGNGRRSTDGSRKSEDEIEIEKRFVYGNGRRSTEDSRDKFANSNDFLDKRFVYRNGRRSAELSYGKFDKSYDFLNKRFVYGNGRRSTDLTKGSAEKMNSDIDKRFVYGNGKRSTENSKNKYIKKIDDDFVKRFVYGNGRRTTDESKKTNADLEESLDKQFVYNGRRSTDESKKTDADLEDSLDKRFVYGNGRRSTAQENTRVTKVRSPSEDGQTKITNTYLRRGNDQEISQKSRATKSFTKAKSDEPKRFWDMRKDFDAVEEAKGKESLRSKKAKIELLKSLLKRFEENKKRSTKRSTGDRKSHEVGDWEVRVLPKGANLERIMKELRDIKSRNE